MHSVANVNMAEIEVAKFDSSAQQRVEEGSGQQMKSYGLSNVPGSLISMPLDSKTSVGVSMVPQHHAWSM